MPANATRVSLEPAYVLHRYDWSESSSIIEAFTRNQGRVALVAKGAKRPSSQLRPVLLPMQLLRVTYFGAAEVKNLSSAEWVGGYAMPAGQTLLTGFYLNELMLRLLPRDEPHTFVLDCYAQTTGVILQNSSLAPAALRAFELLLLKNMGYLPDLTRQTQTQLSLVPEQLYNLNAQQGLYALTPSEETFGVSGAHWQAIHEAIATEPANKAFTHLLGHLANEPKITQALKKMLRTLLQYHCGLALKTPQAIASFQQF